MIFAGRLRGGKFKVVSYSQWDHSNVKGCKNSFEILMIRSLFWYILVLLFFLCCSTSLCFPSLLCHQLFESGFVCEPFKSSVCLILYMGCGISKLSWSNDFYLRLIITYNFHDIRHGSVNNFWCLLICRPRMKQLGKQRMIYSTK